MDSNSISENKASLKLLCESFSYRGPTQIGLMD